MTFKDIPHHLYIGSQMIYVPTGMTGTFNGLNYDSFLVKTNGVNRWLGQEHCKLILRRLSYMTKQEAIEFCFVAAPDNFGPWLPGDNNPYKAIRHEYVDANGIQKWYDVSCPFSDETFLIDLVKGMIRIKDRTYSANGMNVDSLNPGYWNWYLQKGFWMFGDKAFDEGIIIDAATL